MKKEVKEQQTKGLLSSLHFNPDMDEAMRISLEQTGSSLPRVNNYEELLEWREGVAQMGLALATRDTPYDKQIIIEDKRVVTSDADIRLRVYRPLNMGDRLPVLYWMHGGGMIGGTPEQDDPQLKQIAVEAGALVVSVDYRLAPEHPFPIPLRDCYDGLSWVVDHAADLGIDSSRIAVGGASAGGGLAASLAMLSRDMGRPAIIHQSLTYPMLDNRNETNSSFQISDLGIWDRGYNIYVWNEYLKHAIMDEGESYAVPAVVNNLSELPPAFIAVGSLDLFRDEDIEFALRLMEAGVSTELHFYHGAVHGFDWQVPDGNMSQSFITKRIQALKTSFSVARSRS